MTKESALTGGGGVNGTTNAFVSSLWYADWLGFAAKSGVSAVFRETLMGGYYEIVNKSSYLPNPDAFTMALFSRLMGPKVLSLSLNITSSTAGSPPNVTQMLRGYAHCTRSGDGATLLLINLASDTSFRVALPPTRGPFVPGQKLAGAELAEAASTIVRLKFTLRSHSLTSYFWPYCTLSF